MPKILIKEVDSTLASAEAALSHTVYIPGRAAEATGPVMCYSESALKEIKGLDTGSIAFALATILLNQGIYVLYEGFTGEGPTEDTWDRLKDKANYDIRFLCAGDFANTENNKAHLQDMINCAAVRGDCVALLDHALTMDPPQETENIYRLLVTKPGNFDEDPTAYFVRKDTYTAVEGEEAPNFVANYYYVSATVGSATLYFVLTEKPSDWDTKYNTYFVATTVYETADAGASWAENTYYAEEAVPNTTVASVREYFSGLTNGAFAAAFTPWFVTKNAKFTNGAEEVSLPASFGYLSAYATAVKNYNEYEAMAGSARGLIDLMYEPTIKYTSAECEMLQARATKYEVDLDHPEDNVGVAINPIAYVRPFGYIIWGNRTLTNNSGATKATAFLNVRNLISTVKKRLYDTARKYTFELNSEVLWTRFSNDITPLLDDMVSGNGLVGYRFNRVATKQKARLKARLTIIPIEAVEDFDLTIELTDSLDVTEQ